MKLAQLIESFRNRHQARAWWEMPESETRGKHSSPSAPRIPPPSFSFSLNEIAPRPPTVIKAPEAAELDHVTLNRPSIPCGNRRSRNRRTKDEAVERREGETEEPETIRFQSKNNDLDSFLVESDL